MGEFFRSIKFKIILALTALLVGLMLYSANSSGQTFFGSAAVGNIFNPVRRFFSSVATSAETGISEVTNPRKYYDENQKLKEQIAELQKDLIDYESTKTELEELRKFMGIKEEHSDYSHTAPCDIVGRTTNDPYGSFTIDRGSDDDIELYDPVVTAEGLVGVITEVAPKYSTVKSILSPDVSLGAICVQSKDTGVLEGSAQYAVDGLCKMIYIDKAHKIKAGDLVVTSGASGLLPKDYIIGTVKEVKTEESGLSCYAVIEPSVDSRQISSVVVITSFDGQGEGYED